MHVEHNYKMSQFDAIGGNWEAKPDYSIRRIGRLQAGLIRNANGSTGIVVVGGPQEKSSEIFWMDEQKWSNGPDLPHVLYNGGIVQWKDTFILVGGQNDTNHLQDDLWMFDVEEQSWKVMNEKLTMDKTGLNVALLVPDSYCQN